MTDDRSDVARAWPAHAALAAVMLLAAAELRAEYLGPAWQVYLFKPAVTTLLIAIAAWSPGRPGGHYRPLIVAGLVCSLAGDVFLMLPGDLFVAGLASFFLAHVCYIGAFVSSARPRATWPLAAPYATYLIVFLVFLRPYLGGMAGLVAAYGVTLACMGWQAAERWRALRTAAAASAALGAALFVFSDSVIAVNRFVGRFDAARLVIMTTYVAGQWLIARSVAEGRPRPPAFLFHHQ